MLTYDKLYIDGAWVDALRERHARGDRFHHRGGLRHHPRRRRPPTSTARSRRRRPRSRRGRSSRPPSAASCSAASPTRSKRAVTRSPASSRHEVGHAEAPGDRPRQVGGGISGFSAAAELATTFAFEDTSNGLVVREPVGVVGCITPWNYPLNQIGAKVAYALAAGCTVVLKPSEVAPVNAFILAEIIDEIGFPAGVFNLVSGVGPVVGEALAAHPDVDMVSFTGSTRAGKRVAELAAPSIKKVALELGGKSPYVHPRRRRLPQLRSLRASAPPTRTRARRADALDAHARARGRGSPRSSSSRARPPSRTPSAIPSPTAPASVH